MIIGEHRDQVIANIQQAVEDQDFSRKVEVDDPELTRKERANLLSRYLKRQGSFRRLVCVSAARTITRVLTCVLNRHNKIEGLENLTTVHGGAIVTSNHFSPLDNLIIRKTISRAFSQRLYIVSQDTNLAMKGFVGFLMNYADTLPISGSTRYMNSYFNPTMSEMLKKGRKILIYPEQEMWFNYRKPRPVKRGAYYYAAVNSVPVISCFVEIKSLSSMEKDKNFHKTSYVMHVLAPVYPDPEKSVSENSRAMMKTDYRQKKEAYEKAYGKTLTYDFDDEDIAGWIRS